MHFLLTVYSYKFSAGHDILAHMDDERIYQLQDAIHRFRRSESRNRIGSLNDHLKNPQGQLASLVHNLNRINRLNQSLKVILPPPMGDHCQIAHIKENQLVLAVDSGEWASRLRYEKLTLLSYLRNNGFAMISGIDIIVSPEQFRDS